MPPRRNAAELRIEGPGRREVVARFDGGRMSSDAGAVPLREADRVVGVTAKLASCFTDFRAPRRVEHDLETLVAQRVYGLALGCEDLNDHDVLRDGSVLALALGKRDITGAMRSRSRDLRHPLAGSSTLNRLELDAGGDRAASRSHRRPGARPSRGTLLPRRLRRLLLSAAVHHRIGRARRPVGIAESDDIGRDDAEPVFQPGQHGAPVGPSGHPRPRAVQQRDRRARAPVVQVGRDAPGIDDPADLRVVHATCGTRRS